MPVKYDYDWNKLQEKQQLSGMNMKKFCRENKSFKNHKYQSLKKADNFSIIPVKQKAPDTIVFEINGISLSIDASIYDEGLRRIVKAMTKFHDIAQIYMVRNYTNLRKGIDGYASLIQDIHHLDPFQDALYTFCNRHRNKVKCLYWDGSGFWLLYKRLDKGHFKWEKNEEGVILLTQQQIN